MLQFRLQDPRARKSILSNLIEKMKDFGITIISYEESHQFDIDQMVDEIALEFDKPIKLKPTDKTPLIPEQYWVALHKEKVIGSIGVIKIDNEISILKRMFLKKSFRGKDFGASKLLLETAVDWCTENGIKQIYLGTMDQFKAAQSFYLKNGFGRISENELPNNFLINPLDNVFFRLNLSN